MSVQELNSNESILKKTSRILIISAWYSTFAFYPMFMSDNQVVASLSGITMMLLTMLFVVLAIATAVKYKGALMELIQKKRSDRVLMINCFLYVAVSIYEFYFCPKAYQIYVSYGALTIMVINCVIFVFENSWNSKKEDTEIED